MAWMETIQSIWRSNHLRPPSPQQALSPEHQRKNVLEMIRIKEAQVLKTTHGIRLSQSLSSHVQRQSQHKQRHYRLGK